MVRNSKTERIRRLLAAAMAECDSSVLERVRTEIVRTMRMLDSAVEVGNNKKAGRTSTVTARPTADPRRTIELLDAMARREANKFSDLQQDELLNG